MNGALMCLNTCIVRKYYTFCIINCPATPLSITKYENEENGTGTRLMNFNLTHYINSFLTELRWFNHKYLTKNICPEISLKDSVVSKYSENIET